MPCKEFRGVTQGSFQSHSNISTQFQGVIPQLSQQKTKTEEDFLHLKTGGGDPSSDPVPYLSFHIFLPIPDS